jgi:acyl-CoA thioesterase I
MITRCFSSGLLVDCAAMRSHRLVLIAAIVSLAACAADPPYKTGSGGSGGGGGGMGGGGSAGSGLAGYTPPALRLSRPNPIISRAAQVFASAGTTGAPTAIDGRYHAGGWIAGRPTEAAPAWLALKLSAGPTRVLVSWDDGATYNYKDPPATTVYGLPGAYHIDVSANSTNGSDGTWTTALPSVTNEVRARAHAIDFSGMSWIKLVVTATPANESNNVIIGEIDVHDISATGAGLPEDTWFFMGDSITAFAYDRAAPSQPSFAAAINTATSQAYYPAMINGGIGSELTPGALARLDEALALNPDYHFFAITYGTNDSWGRSDATAFKATLQMMIDKIKAAGREPVLSHVPFSPDGNHNNLAPFNAAIDDLTRTNQLQIGPDFYGHFMQHPEQLMDMVHPNVDGRKAMNRLWAEAMRALYP